MKLVRRAAIVGMPRSGTTWLAAALNRQPGVRWLSDYLNSFPLFLEQSGAAWYTRLTLTERRSALAMVRQNLLSVGHRSNISAGDFVTLDELHARVCDELAAGDRTVVGCKYWLRARELAQLLNETEVLAVLMIRDPRDAAFSFWHRSHGGAEVYLEDWCQAVQLACSQKDNKNLVVLRFEEVFADPERALRRVLSALGLSTNVSVLDGELASPPNSMFDPSPSGRETWLGRIDDPIVQYAGWRCQPYLKDVGYAEGPATSLRQKVTMLQARAAASLQTQMRAATHRICAFIDGRFAIRPKSDY
jgi:hypothetical protein